METGYRKGRAYALSGLGQIALAQGDLAQARKAEQEALTIRTEMGDELNTASSRLDLAMVSIEEGRAADAEASLRQAVDVLRKTKSTAQEASANAALARALLAQAKPSEAAAALQRATALLTRSTAFPVRFDVALAGARVNPAGARQRLEANLADAVKHGYVGYQFEIRLALGQLEKNRARLDALAHDASATGFGLVARKARGPL